MVSLEELLKAIEHALVKPTHTASDIRKACEEAAKWRIGAICVAPCFVEVAKSALEGSDVRVCSVIGFPFGYSPTQAKEVEVVESLRKGADDLDIVMNVPMFLSGEEGYVREEISRLCHIAREEADRLGRRVTVKVIIETSLLNEDQIAKAARICEECGADFVKTCTGFGPRGVTLRDIEIIKGTIKEIGIKASGGIRILDDALKFYEAGATRIGTSKGIDIAKEIAERLAH